MLHKIIYHSKGRNLDVLFFFLDECLPSLCSSIVLSLVIPMSGCTECRNWCPLLLASVAQWGILGAHNQVSMGWNQSVCSSGDSRTFFLHGHKDCFAVLPSFV